MMRWCAMLGDDLMAVSAMSDAVHGAYTERVGIYAERCALYPEGCFVLDGEGGVSGYLVSHPWINGAPPVLDRPIFCIPPDATLYYLHDLALLPDARGQGAGDTATALVVAQALKAGFGTIALTAVHGAEHYWRRHGFVEAVGGEHVGYGAGSVAMTMTIETGR